MDSVIVRTVKNVCLTSSAHEPALYKRSSHWRTATDAATVLEKLCGFHKVQHLTDNICCVNVPSGRITTVFGTERATLVKNISTTRAGIGAVQCYPVHCANLGACFQAYRLHSWHYC